MAMRKPYYHELRMVVRGLVPESKFKQYLTKKYRKQIDESECYRLQRIDDENFRLWGTSTNMPLQTKESMKLISSLVEKVIQKRLKGDIIECGVYRGGTSFMMAKKLIELKSDKKLYALDTFEGQPYDDFHNMPKSGWASVYSDKIPRKYIGELNNVDLNQIKNLFTKEKITNTIFLKGLFEDSFKVLQEKKFCFAHVDADSYLSVKQCIEFLHSRIISGGIIFFHDYDNADTLGCNKAVDDIFGKEIKTVKPQGTYWIKP